ncbi:DMT family transporter [Ramlibacter albus]|uniref:DMT family transporter n=1 Tax=Ramlibacter albus TaxID=2079448 RepID=A0A923M6T8_9BURK|nr:DMT family transporter [Ramlibacter albus]MBC5763869.1 DMT family transporter [Ramlibacter albus]
MRAGDRLAPAAALVLNAFVWGLSWWPFRELQERGFHPLWSTAFTYFVAVAFFTALHPGAWRPFLREPKLWLLAAASGLTNVGFNWGVTVGDVVRVVLLFYLMPAWSVLLAWALLGERPTGAGIARLLLALAGVAIVLKRPDAAWPVPESLADWLGVAGGFSFALTNVMLRKLPHVPAPSRLMAMFGGGGTLAIAAAGVGALQHVVVAPPAPGLAEVLFILLLSVGFICANLGWQYGASRLPAQATALIMLSEVLFASASSAWLGAGEITPRILAGAALIVAAAAWSAWPSRRRGAELHA